MTTYRTTAPQKHSPWEGLGIILQSLLLPQYMPLHWHCLPPFTHYPLAFFSSSLCFLIPCLCTHSMEQRQKPTPGEAVGAQLDMPSCNLSCGTEPVQQSQQLWLSQQLWSSTTNKQLLQQPGVSPNYLTCYCLTSSPFSPLSFLSKREKD